MYKLVVRVSERKAKKKKKKKSQDMANPPTDPPLLNLMFISIKCQCKVKRCKDSMAKIISGNNNMCIVNDYIFVYSFFRQKPLLVIFMRLLTLYNLYRIHTL